MIMLTNLLLMLASIATVPSLAHDFDYIYEGKSLHYTVIDEEAKTCMVSGPTRVNNEITIKGELIIPETASDGTNDYTVIMLENKAFLNCTGLTDVTIPNTVSFINDLSFGKCSGLRSVVLPEDLSYIGDAAFYQCNNLASINIPNTVTTIGKYAFNQCGSLTSMTIPNSVVHLGNNAFSSCTSLESLTIGTSLTRIPADCFFLCTALKQVVIPSTVKEIEAFAFRGCRLDEISIGAGLESLEDLAFDDVNAAVINITSQKPPKSNENAFSDYSATLRIQDTDDGHLSSIYANTKTCWSRFTNRGTLIPATELNRGESAPVKYKAGETQQLYATVEPAEASLPYVFWHSTNPLIATVDNYGLVKFNELHESDADDSYRDLPCTIVATTLYADGPILEFNVEDIPAGVNSVMTENNNGTIDFSAPVDVYNMTGCRIADTLDNVAPGIYIVRQGNIVIKIAIK